MSTYAVQISSSNDDEIYFSESSVSYKNTAISYRDILGLVFSSKRFTYMFTSRTEYTFAVRSARDSIKVRFTTAFGVRRVENEAANRALLELSVHFIFPCLIERLIGDVMQARPVQIHDLALSKSSLILQPFLFLGPKYLPWEFYNRCECKEGFVNVYGKNPQKAKETLFTTIRLEYENAIIVPQLLEAIRAVLHGANSE